MDKEDFVKEHKNLVKVLRSGTKSEQLKEADEQEGELSKHLSKTLPGYHKRLMADKKMSKKLYEKTS